MFKCYWKYCLASIFMLLSPVCFALKCAPPPTIAQRFAAADSVFTVKVTEVAEDKRSANFVIEKFYKGEQQPKQLKMTIRPMRYWFDKAFFSIEQRYLVFYSVDQDLFWAVCKKNIYFLNEQNTSILDDVKFLQKQSK